MFQHSTLKFLQDLRKNNDRDWFDKHKDQYQAALQDFLNGVQQLILGISEFDEGVRASHLEPKGCVMRIYRDVRFSQDKSPFKSNFFTFINRAGRKSPFAGYYLNLSPGESFMGGGVYMPDKLPLDAIRQAIDLRVEEWMEIAGDSELLEAFREGVKPSGKLKRPPRGYDADHPAIEYLKHKGFYTQQMLSDEETLSPDLLPRLFQDYRRAHRLVTFLNEAVEEGMQG
jgi:uncharacterized protein (TIGR02453 family)